MSRLKGFGKAALCLVCCIACLLAISPVGIVSAAGITSSVTSVPMAPGISLDNMATVSEGRLVSVVRRTYYNGSTVIGCLENGTKLTVLGTKNGFYKIDCYDMTGYISKKQVVKTEAGEYYVNCNPSSSESKYLKSYSTKEALDLKGELMTVAKKYIGVKYVWGGTTPKGFDCSGYTSYVFDKIGIDIQRTVLKQLSDGVIVSKEDLQPGDLIIFSNTTGSGHFASHVGIYMGNDKVIHCGSSKGVTIVNLSDSYYTKHYQCARRIILTDVAISATIPTMDTIASSVGSDWRK